jgi:hypothetical protein
VDDAVRALAKAAGVAVDWIDAADRPQRVSIGSLRRVLDGLGYPNGSKSDIVESRRRLRDLANGTRAFFTATVGEPITAGAMRLPAIHEPGYHRLNGGGRACSFGAMGKNSNRKTEGRVSSVGKPYHNTTELAGFMKVNDTSAAGR